MRLARGLFSHYEELYIFEKDRERNSERKSRGSLSPYFQQEELSLFFLICVCPCRRQTGVLPVFLSLWINEIGLYFQIWNRSEGMIPSRSLPSGSECLNHLGPIVVWSPLMFSQVEMSPTNVGSGFQCFSNLIGSEFYFAYLKSLLP